MKLVVDNDSNVEPIPIGNLMDIAGEARRFADEVESGSLGDVVSVTLLIESSDGLSRHTWGEVPSGYELIGMLETVKMAIIADDCIED
jgi:hypothetical protein